MTLYGVVGLVGVSAFVLALVLLHALQPDIDWARHYVSEFANGRFRLVFLVGAAAHGLGNLVLVAGLRRSLGPGGRSGAAVLLFALAAAGVLTAALFPTDTGGAARTISGLVHRLAATLAFAIELVALFLFSSAFAASPVWHRWASRSFAWATLTGVSLAALLLAIVWNRFPGLAERAALGSFLVWESGVAFGLVRLHPGAAFPGSRPSGRTRGEGMISRTSAPNTGESL